VAPVLDHEIRRRRPPQDQDRDGDHEYAEEPTRPRRGRYGHGSVEQGAHGACVPARFLAEIGAVNGYQGEGNGEGGEEERNSLVQDPHRGIGGYRIDGGQNLVLYHEKGQWIDELEDEKIDNQGDGWDGQEGDPYQDEILRSGGNGFGHRGPPVRAFAKGWTGQIVHAIFSRCVLRRDSLGTWGQ